MPQSQKKTKSGEHYDSVYMTSFTVPLVRPDGTGTMIRAKVQCPTSEMNFYRLIGHMNDKHLIDDFTHITAERLMFLEGYLRVD